MTHQFYESGNRQHPLVDEFKHSDQRELYHRHTAGSLGATTLFLFGQVRGVVGSYHTDTSVGQRLT